MKFSGPKVRFYQSFVSLLFIFLVDESHPIGNYESATLQYGDSHFSTAWDGSANCVPSFIHSLALKIGSGVICAHVDLFGLSVLPWATHMLPRLHFWIGPNFEMIFQHTFPAIHCPCANIEGHFDMSVTAARSCKTLIDSSQRKENSINISRNPLESTTTTALLLCDL